MHEAEDNLPNRSTYVTSYTPPRWELVKGGVTARRILRKLRCFLKGHEAIHVSCNIYQCTRCYRIGE
jgi:hypothetical protein